MNEPRCMVGRKFCRKSDPHPMQQITSPAGSCSQLTTVTHGPRRQTDVKLHQFTPTSPTSPTSSLHIHSRLHSACSPSESEAVPVRSICYAFPEQGLLNRELVFTLSGNVPAGFSAELVVKGEVELR